MALVVYPGIPCRGLPRYGWPKYGMPGDIWYDTEPSFVPANQRAAISERIRVVHAPTRTRVVVDPPKTEIVAIPNRTKIVVIDEG